MKDLLKKLWFQVIIGMFLGIVVGLLLSPTAFALVPKDIALGIAPWVALIGNVFLALIQMIVIPLIMSSIILGITSAEDTQTLKTLGLKIAPYFVFTTIIAVTIGIFITYLIHPGTYVSVDIINQISNTQVVLKEATILKDISMPDMIVDLIPVNSVRKT